MKKFILTLLILFAFNCTARVVLKMNSTEVDVYNKKPDYVKRQVNQFIGFREYSLPVSPNKPQKFKSTWFTTKEEIETHKNKVCQNGVSSIVLRGDYWDYFQHFFIGGISSSKSVEVYCN